MLYILLIWSIDLLLTGLSFEGDVCRFKFHIITTPCCKVTTVFIVSHSHLFVGTRRRSPLSVAAAAIFMISQLNEKDKKELKGVYSYRGFVVMAVRYQVLGSILGHLNL